MKIAAMKIGSRLTWDANDKTGGLGEAKAMLELLADEHRVSVYTKLLKNENTFPKDNIYLFDIMAHEPNEEILLVFNGHVNFFGGNEDPEQIEIYKKINAFKGEVYYIYIDPELYPTQIWKSIEKKPWAKKYKKEEIIIERKINVITSVYNMWSAFEKLNKGGVVIEQKNIHYFPFEKYPLLTEGLDYNPQKDYQLMYMGTFRGGKREAKMIEFYFGHQDVRVDFIGKTKLEDFKKLPDKPGLYAPTFNSPIPFEEVKYHVNKSLAHVCIGDKFYEGNILTPRIYECINFSTVCFIDLDLDSEKRVFNNEILRKFNYVANKKELKQRIEQLLKRPKLAEKIAKLQKEDIHFSRQSYLETFNEILEPSKKKGLIKADSTIHVNDFNLNKIQYYDLIEKHKKSYVITEPQVNFNRYPGFVFSNDNHAQFYYENFYREIEDVFTPPRGNLTMESTHAFFGIKPGSYQLLQVQDKIDVHECCWLLGPSSEMLNKLLEKTQIYPYFSNVYKFHEDELNGNIDLTIKEIETIAAICPNIELVFLGKYEDYFRIIEKIGDIIKYRFIWHPAYLARSFSQEKFNRWQDQLCE